MSRFPFYKQLDSSDCGSACLRIVARYWGRKYTSRTLRRLSSTGRAGASLLGLSRAAEEIGLEAKAYKVTWEVFRGQVERPCVVHWDKNHFAVVYDIRKTGRGERVLVADPACGRVAYEAEEFQRHWLVAADDPQGIVLTLRPTERFHTLAPEKEKTFGFRNFGKYLLPLRRPIGRLVLAMLLGSLISLVFPFLTQAVVDVGIGNGDLHFILLLLLAQLMLTVGQLGNDMIRGWLMLHITLRISISFLSDFLNKLLRLPVSFFDVKKVGDVMQRIEDNARIQSFLTGSLISIAIAAVTFIVYAAVMAGYDPFILLVFLAGSALYVAWIAAFLRRRRALDTRRFGQMAANQSNIVQLVTGMQEIKLNNCEQYKLWEWERIQAKLYRISTNALALEQTQHIGGTFINQVKNIVVSYLAARLVVEGELTLGMMMAMQYILGQLNAPLGQFIGFVQSAQDARISLERLGEIYRLEDEEPEDGGKIREIPACGNIEFRDVAFRYEGPDSPKVLDGLNLTIRAGKVNAIVGTSGSGKTTVLKLLLGFYRPEEGRLRLAGKDLCAYSDREWRSRCGIVMQDGFIFSDTILGNIGVSDEKPDRKRAEYAARVANIHDFIAGLPLGYETVIGMEGSGLSSGQKQRILIARAVYRNPDYIFMDEATNALDANNEKTILENLNEFYRGRTVVIVAHRLSTVKHADRIAVIDEGKVKEAGTHEELIRMRGLYYALVSNQLELGG